MASREPLTTLEQSSLCQLQISPGPAAPCTPAAPGAASSPPPPGSLFQHSNQPRPEHLCASTRPGSQPQTSTTSNSSSPSPPPHRAPNSFAPVPVAMQVHAAHGGCVSIQCVHAFARVCVPHFERAVRGAADDNAVPHLGGPDPPRVADESLHALQRTVRWETFVWERLKDIARGDSKARDLLWAGGCLRLSGQRAISLQTQVPTKVLPE